MVPPLTQIQCLHCRHRVVLRSHADIEDIFSPMINRRGFTRLDFEHVAHVCDFIQVFHISSQLFPDYSQSPHLLLFSKLFWNNRRIPIHTRMALTNQAKLFILPDKAWRYDHIPFVNRTFCR